MVISPGVRALLDCIGAAEAGARGYNAMYLPAERKLGPQTLTAMTVSQVQALQQRMVKVAPSSAAGRYQFIRRTLANAVKTLGIPGTARFDANLQDRLAVHLLEARGLSKFLAGRMSREAFANNLAREWASLPVVTPVNGKQVGQSYHAGDGLNHALVKPGTVLLLLNGLAASPPGAEPVITPTAGPVPDPGLDMRRLPEAQDRGALKRLGALLAATAAGAMAWVSENPIAVGIGIAATAAIIAIIVWRTRK